MSGSVRDMAVPGGGDMAVPGDLGPADMAIPNDALKPVLYSQFAADFVKVMCTHLAQCGQVGTDATSQAQCMEANALHWGVDYDTEIVRGHIIVNELQCLDALMNSRCDQSDFGYVNDRCSTFLFLPQQQTGQACVDSRECINGYCQMPAAAGGGYQPTGCAGTCQPFKTTTCDTADSCNKTIALCDQGSFMCKPKLVEGATCPAANNACQTGLYCPSYGTKTCSKPMMQMMLNGPCDPAQAASTNVPPCAPGLACIYTSGAHTAATCVMPIDNTGTCDATSFYNAFNNPCKDTFRCDATTGKCDPFGMTGAGCYSALDCQTNFYCNGAPGTCQPSIADGMSCTNPDSCMSSKPHLSGLASTCIVPNGDAGSSTVCEPYLNFGASCTPNFDDVICYPAGGGNATSLCAPSANGGGKCAPRCM